MTEQTATTDQTEHTAPTAPLGQTQEAFHPAPAAPPYRRLVRTDGPVSGVCGGIGAYLGVDPTVVRVLTALAVLLTLPLGPILYLVLWAVVPRD